MFGYEDVKPAENQVERGGGMKGAAIACLVGGKDGK